MDEVISDTYLINNLRNHKVKLIIVGALIDLKMQNGWVKQDEFVPIDFNEATKTMESVLGYGEDVFEFTSKLIDANNEVRAVTICGKANNFSTNYSSPDIKLPNVTDIVASVSGSGLTCFNVRLVTHVSIGCQVIGMNYANGDFLKRNVSDYSSENNYR